MNKLKFVARPPLHYLIKFTIELMFWILEVNGAEMDAYESDNDNPMSACFNAPQSFAPSPHIAVTFPIYWNIETILVLLFGFDRAKTLIYFKSYFLISVIFPSYYLLYTFWKIYPVTHKTHCYLWIYYREIEGNSSREHVYLMFFMTLSDLYDKSYPLSSYTKQILLRVF